MLWGCDENGYQVQPMAQQIVDGVELRGGKLYLDGSYELRAWLPKKNRKQLQELLRDRHACVFQYLLEQRPKIEIPVACHCDQKPYAHLKHDPPLGDEQPPVFVKGGFKELREALIRCKSQPEGWDMGDLVGYLEESSKTGK